MGRLHVRVCEARNLCDTQWISKPDPYCRVRCGDRKYKTDVIDNQLNPVWDELFVFQIADENTTQLQVEVWNDNVFADELMGRYNLSVNGLHRGNVMDYWCVLSGSKTNAEVHLRVLAVDFGLLAEPGKPVMTTLEFDPPIKLPPTQKVKKQNKDKKNKTNSSLNTVVNTTTSSSYSSNPSNSNAYPASYSPATVQPGYSVPPPSSAYPSAPVAPQYSPVPPGPIQQVSWPPPQQPLPSSSAYPSYGAPPQPSPPVPQPYASTFYPPANSNPAQSYAYGPPPTQSNTASLFPGVHPQPPPPQMGGGGGAPYYGYQAQPTQPPAQYAFGIPPGS